MNRTLRLTPVKDLSTVLRSGKLVAFGIGPDGVAYLVAATGRIDYHSGGFAKTVTNDFQRYHVVGLSGNRPVLDIVTDKERFNIQFVQPLVDEVLLVCARCHYKATDDFERNGRVYTRTGKFVREMLLGDGIQSVQTTSQGFIWTSFFDEGVFGNFGWTNPVGASGLVGWGSSGNKQFEFQPRNGLEPICDCYALNVASDDDVWCYYYTEFPLVRLRSRAIESVWRMRFGGSDAFAISAGYALFRGGYLDRDVYRLYSLGADGEVLLEEMIEFVDNDGNRLVAEHVVGRADAIYLVCRGKLYRIDVSEVIAG
jgi:hypothetical protein